MNLQKAIEIKEHYQYILQDASLPELIEADNLSIEALKRLDISRLKGDLLDLTQLPGETSQDVKST